MIIDWLLQVFRVLQSDTPKTLFLAVNMIDRYLLHKQKEGHAVDKKQLHLLGLASAFISSKYEIEKPFTMAQMVSDASHNKFSSQDLAKKEMDVL